MRRRNSDHFILTAHVSAHRAPYCYRFCPSVCHIEVSYLNECIYRQTFRPSASPYSFSEPQIIIIISGLHHYEYVALLVANSLQSGWFWARSTASVHDSPWESRSFCIQVIHGRSGGLFQYAEAEEVKICLASILSSIREICLNRVRCRAWIISVSRGWLVWR